MPDVSDPVVPVQVQDEYAHALRGAFDQGHLETRFMVLVQPRDHPAQEPFLVQERSCHEQNADPIAEESNPFLAPQSQSQDSESFQGSEQPLVEDGAPVGSSLAPAPDTSASTQPQCESVNRRRPDQKLVATVFSGIGVFDLSATQVCTVHALGFLRRSLTMSLCRSDRSMWGAERVLGRSQCGD